MIITAAILLQSSHSTFAVSGSDWSSGNIISDGQFFNSNSMSTNDIQNFLNSMVPNCDTWGNQPYGSGTRAQQGTSTGYPPPYVCLKDYFENPTTHQNNANGGAVDGGWSAAQIIKYASDTYSINPKVLLVLLQKEQSLVTDTWPYTSQYRSATGYGCPDTAPCDEEYYGFYNQVTNAAFQFQLYARKPGNYRYKAYQNNFIQWSPAAGCGGSDVYIANQATAGLYSYTPYQPNAAALGNLYGSGDSCSAYGNRNFWRLYNDWFGSSQYEETFINYQSQLSFLGWTGYTTNNGVTGTTGQSRPMESFRITGDVNYSSYNYTTGWQPTVSDGMVSGTINLSRPIQAIKIAPTGSLSDRYDIYYRVHLSGVGWMGWTKNGQPAGITGDSNKDIEAFEIRLVVKGYGISGSTDNSYQNVNTISYNPSLSLNIASHVGMVGWQSTVSDDMISGTINESKRIEAVKISLNNNTSLSGDVIYSAHVEEIGWQDFKSNGDIAGTVGQSKRIEAVRIALTGDLGDNYDIWYRGHVQYIGWTNWAKNGQPTGSVGASLQLEAIEVRVAPKQSISLPQQGSLYNPNNQLIPQNDTLSCAAHVSYTGWIDNVQQDNTCGTTGQSKTLEAIKLSGVTSIFGDLDINCSVFIKNADWTVDTASGNACGTTGQSKPLQAIRLSLIGDAADKYDIYYRVHLSYTGWQDWVNNGTVAGTPVSGNNIEAVDIKLVQK